MSTTGTATTFEFKGVIRFHTKSKRGCLTCRKRRIKCDETRPTCRNCYRRNLECVQRPKNEDHQERRQQQQQEMNNASLHYRNLHFFLLRPCNRHHIPQHPASAIVAEPTPPARYIILHGPSPRSPIPRIPNPTGYIVHPLIGKLR
ncbi:c6 zinc finger domain protein [Moniliophthora roreri]|nr:c6 zinc finger domain protein [Moniliophthora roreri]